MYGVHPNTRKFLILLDKKRTLQFKDGLKIYKNLRSYTKTIKRLQKREIIHIKKDGSIIFTPNGFLFYKWFIL